MPMCYWHPYRADASPHLSKAKSKLHESGQSNADKQGGVPIGQQQVTNKRQTRYIPTNKKPVFHQKICNLKLHHFSWERLLIETWREFIDA